MVSPWCRAEVLIWALSLRLCSSFLQLDPRGAPPHVRAATLGGAAGPVAALRRGRWKLISSVALDKIFEIQCRISNLRFANLDLSRRLGEMGPLSQGVQAGGKALKYAI